MKFTLLRENIQKALMVIQRIVSKNLSLPILEHVLMKTEDKKLKLSATNLELGIHVWVKGRMDEEGVISVPAFLLGNIINSIQEERVTLLGKGFDLEVSAQNINALIKGQDSNDFPLIPKPEEKKHISLPRKAVVEGITPLSHIVMVSDVYPEISGIFFSFSKDMLTLVGTDSFRLGKKEVPMSVPKEAVGTKFILPLKSSQEILFILRERIDEVVDIGINENQMFFSMDDMYIFSRLLAGNYPNYQDLIPDNFVTEVVVSRKEFIDTIKLIGVFAPKTNDCKVMIEDNKVTLSTTAATGSSQARLNARIKGRERVHMTFNYRYLLDGCLAMTDKDVMFRIKDETSPILFEGTMDRTYTYLIAPLKS